MKKNNFLALFIILVLFIFIPCFFCNVVNGQTNQTEDLFETKPDSSGDDAAGTVKLDNPLGGINTAQDLIGQIINAVLGVVGSLALLMFVYGGLTWMTASGNEERIKKGKGILMWATIGLVVIFTSYTVLNFVIGILGGT